jgi:hypothetical protein
VRRRFPLWAVLAALAVVSTAAIAVVATVRQRSNSIERLIERLPSGDAAIVYVDFAALRRAGLLGAIAGRNATQEPEYRAFVDQTGFDYLHDLDAALVSIHPRGTFMLVRGRFDWKALEKYITGQGGTCSKATCKMQGSRPERKISLFPLQTDLMALAVSPDGAAVEQLRSRRSGLVLAPPGDPIWAFIPVSVLTGSASLPEGTRSFASAMAGADRILLAAGPEGGQMAIRLEVACRTASDAGALAVQLTAATRALRESSARQRQASSPADLIGVLAGGAFEAKGDRVHGTWPLPRAFLEALAGAPLT